MKDLHSWVDLMYFCLSLPSEIWRHVVPHSAYIWDLAGPGYDSAGSEELRGLHVQWAHHHYYHSQLLHHRVWARTWKNMHTHTEHTDACCSATAHATQTQTYRHAHAPIKMYTHTHACTHAHTHTRMHLSVYYVVEGVFQAKSPWSVWFK